jgi:hypothetical protein
VFGVLAWVFVAFRLLHAIVHVTSNNPNLRALVQMACPPILAAFR